MAARVSDNVVSPARERGRGSLPVTARGPGAKSPLSKGKKLIGVRTVISDDVEKPVLLA